MRKPDWQTAGPALAVMGLLLLTTPPAWGNLAMAVAPMKLRLTLAPGESRTEAVEVYNNGDEPVRVVTTVEDWVTTLDGGVDLTPRGSPSRSATAWTRADLSDFTVPPHGMRVVRVTATLPDTARGSYWTLIFFEGQAGMRRAKLGLGTRVRMGTTVYLTAAGTESRGSTITGMAVQPGADGDTLNLLAKVANRGNVYFYPTGWFQVTDPTGTVLFQQGLPYRVCLPGSETVYRCPWHPTGAGPYRLLLTVDSGEESLLQGIKEFDVAAPIAVGTSHTRAAP
jgi:hypothetical protein